MKVREKNYTVIVEVSDNKNADESANPAMDDFIAVTINVTNVNEEPEFDSATTVRSIAENSAANANVGAVITATDPDASDTLAYSLSGTDAGSFTIDSSGQIKVGASPTLDYESAKKIYSVTVEVHDGENADGDADTTTDDTVGVTINVTDLNEKPTFTETGTATRSIAENSAISVSIGLPVAATDPENDTLTYTLGGTDVAHFSIVGTSGQLQTKSALDKEIKASYEVTISVHDGKNDAGTVDTAEDANITVTITVTDVEEAGTVALSMTQPSARTQLTATLADPDGGVTGTIWQWAHSDTQDGNYTDITGETSATYTPPDSDVDKFLKATTSYTDRRGPNKTAARVSDNAVRAGANRSPEFTAAADTRSFPENAGAGENIGNPVTATDADNDSPTYSLDATGATSFDIDSASGQIKTKAGVAYDHETKPSYSVTVTAADGNGGTDTIDVTITVTDANDSPQFDELTATREVAENTEAGQPVGDPVTATDLDTGDTLTYTLEGTDTDSFHIVPATGQIQTKSGQTYNYETKPTYSVTVKADDGNGGTDTIAVTINVTNVNEAPTIVDPQTSPSHPENDGGTVATYSATDPEEDQIIWSVSGTDSTHLSINSAGELTFDTPPDFEAPADSGTNNTYVVTVQASGGSETHQLEVTVTVTDVNEAPVFPAGSDTRSVPENTPTDQNIGTPVAAEDPDAGDTPTYALGGTDAASFGIITSTGQLTTKAALNKETKASYSVVVSVHDGEDVAGAPDPTADDTVTVTITVTDVNEKPEFDNGVTPTLAVAENTEPGENVGVPVEASDPDADATLTYSLGGTDASFFSIDESTGQIKVGTGTDLDHETTPSYSVTVSVRDSKDDNGIPDTSPDATILVTINVDDRNEPPDITAGPASEDYTENKEDAVATYTATDPENAALKWTLAGDDADDFSIAEGVLEFASQPNFEAPADEDRNNVYLVTVQVSDGPNSDTQDVVITVTDANDPPAFPGLTATRSVAENATASDPVEAPVTATDPDADDTLAYSLTGDDVNSFDIGTTTGQITVKTGTVLDYEATKKTYTVKVTATDLAAATATVTVTITVTDVNEPPTVTGDPRIWYGENSTGPVATYTATDPEKADLVWSLSGDDSGLFSITNGALSFKNSPNFESPADTGPDNEYNVTVTVSDGRLTGEVDVTVTVTNAEEAGKVTLSSLQPQARTGLVATLTDPDLIITYDTWKWEISSGQKRLVHHQRGHYGDLRAA